MNVNRGRYQYLDSEHHSSYAREMQDMSTTETDGLTRAKNFRANLRRVFDSWAVQSKVAADAGIHAIHIAKILNGRSSNPTIDTMEAISIALEIPIETLLAGSPTNTDLRILEKSG